MDTIPLPNATVSPATAPTDLTTPITITQSTTTIRQRYEQFTGEYVLHCHFLGHEDRGMMFSVQTVCPSQPQVYGKSDRNPECPGTIPALPACPTTPTTTSK
jgi:hypothetical protein